MLPSLAIENPFDRRLVHPIAASNLFGQYPGRPQVLDDWYIGLGEFVLWMMAALCGILSVLGDAIRSIIFVRPKKQVKRIATLSIIAVMAYKDTVWYFSLFKPIRHAMRWFWVLSNGEQPVPFVAEAASPVPTLRLRSSLDVTPKFFRHFQPSLYPSFLSSAFHYTRGSSLALAGTSFATDGAKNRGSLLNIVHNTIIGQPLAHSQPYQED